MKEITNFHFTGEDGTEHPLTAIMWKGQPVWLVSEVGKALGYADRTLNSLIRREWTDELEEDDTIMLIGKDLKEFKQLSGDSTLSYTSALTVLNMSGIRGVILLSKRPAGRRLRHWLKTEVLPQLQEQGTYTIEAAKPAKIGTETSEIQLLKLQIELQHAKKDVAMIECLQAAYDSGRARIPRALVNAATGTTHATRAQKKTKAEAPTNPKQRVLPMSVPTRPGDIPPEFSFSLRKIADYSGMTTHLAKKKMVEMKIWNNAQWHRYGTVSVLTETGKRNEVRHYFRREVVGRLSA